MGNLAKLTISGAIGLLLGLAAVIWVEPDNAGGVALIIVACTALTIVTRAIIRLIIGR